MNSNRVEWIDKTKGMAILLVVLGHISDTKGCLQNWIYSFHMPLFFVVSGYLYSANESRNTSVGVVKYIKKKAVALIYPYFTYALIGIVYQLLRFRYDEVKDAIFKTITLQGYSTLWFLPTLFFAELLFHICMRLHKKGVLLFSLVIILSSFFFSYHEMIFFVMIYRIGVGVVFMSCGYLVYQLVNFKNFPRMFLIKVLCGIVLLINVILACKNGFVDLHYAKMNNAFLYWWGAILSSTCIMVIMNNTSSKINIFSVIGKHTLSIMCISSLLPIIGIFESIFGGLLGFKAEVFIFFVWLFSSICSVLCAIIVDTYLNCIIKWPIKKREKTYEK